MAFRKFGGVEYNKKNNYVSSNTNNNINLNITDQLGQLNTKIITKSHFDFDGQTLFNVGNIIFSDGLTLDELLANSIALNSNTVNGIFSSTNVWTGLNTFANATSMTNVSMANATISGSPVALINANNVFLATNTFSNVFVQNLVASGNVNADGILGSNLIIDTVANIGGELTVEGGITGNDGLTITNGPVLFMDGLTVENGITGSGGLSMSGDSSFANSLTVEGGITGNDGLTITNGPVFIQDNLIVEGGITGGNGINIVGGTDNTNSIYIGNDSANLTINNSGITINGINLAESLSIQQVQDFPDTGYNSNYILPAAVNNVNFNTQYATPLSFIVSPNGNNSTIIIPITGAACILNIGNTVPSDNVFIGTICFLLPNSLITSTTPTIEFNAPINSSGFDYGIICLIANAIAYPIAVMITCSLVSSGFGWQLQIGLTFHQGGGSEATDYTGLQHNETLYLDYSKIPSMLITN